MRVVGKQCFFQLSTPPIKEGVKMSYTPWFLLEQAEPCICTAVVPTMSTQAPVGHSEWSVSGSIRGWTHLLVFGEMNIELEVGVKFRYLTC